MAKRTTLSALTPEPGPWFLDWSRTDREGPFPWPASSTKDFYLLAGYLARLNELSLDEVMSLERVYGGSAVHALAEWDLSEAAEKRWSEIYQRGGFDDADSPQLDVITMTYCIKQVDARRVIVALDSQARVAYPLWWDTKHEVSGSNRDSQPAPCVHEGCHHLPDSA
ncbi:hypothetical protein [Microbacterium aurum]|nr:hypothetical protein [Microbacterium aurum]MBM7826600.1 hypothetical protein [Microbacterium aurum]